ncbi:Holliday junction branch migration protein RuvA [Marinicauda salina]|uniref:Holliday junction branch migration complex subunit RuvA n=1 Tax=Marinicauda salina TaxID=2135793 RepID=A0A2U2BXQ8_9PROT|nr:Holliday junction branch migration protein RuvA [Marinicauda salina]PWE18754.1 Holliday junction branch migration protein RuvA [Marinicauda salina]
MIGKLKGVVDSVAEEDAVIDVGGVGYLVTAGSRTLARLEPGAEASLHIETYVREDVFRLYGFLEEAERAWFVRLQTVQGVGARHALAILDALPAGEIENAAALGDASAFERAKGVGKKLAQRIAAELKDKAPPTGRRLARGTHESLAAVVGGAPAPEGGEPVPAAASAAREAAVSALVNLGYGESEARQAAAHAFRVLGEHADEGRLIKHALKELAR